MKTEQSKIKKFFFNTIVKSIILMLLPLSYGIMFPYAIGQDVTNSLKGPLIRGSVIIFFIHIIVMIIYGREDERQRKQNDNYFNTLTEIKEAKNLLKTADEIIYDVATSIHKLVLSRKKHSDIQDWSYMEAKGDIICKAAFNMVKQLAEKGEDFL